MWIFTVLFACATPSVLPVHGRQIGIYDNLITTITKDVTRPLHIPICAINSSLNVSLDMWLYQLFDLDEPTQMLSIDVWMELGWTDCRVSWNSTVYNNITEFAVAAEKIWIPDLVLYESLHGNLEEGMFMFQPGTARVSSDGRISLGVQTLLKSFCRVEVSAFPFDTQRCRLTFASWTKDNRIFKLLPRATGDAHVLKDSSNGEWEVLRFFADGKTQAYNRGFSEEIARNFTEVTYNIHLVRKPMYLKIYIIFPCLLLAWLGLLVFVLPMECGEKISFSITILLALFLFLLLVADNIPRTSDGIPVLGVYFILSISYVSIALALTCLVLNIGLKDRNICMPSWLRRILVRLSGLVCFHFDSHQRLGQQTRWLSVKRKPKTSLAQNNQQEEEDNQNTPVPSEERSEVAAAENSFENKTVPESSSGTISEWRFMATVLDRTFFLVYLLLNIISTIYLFAA